MNELNIHPLIKLPVIFFALVMVVSIMTIFISDSYLERAYESRESEKRAMRIWKNKIITAKQSNEMMNTYEDGYKKLLKNNIVGKENRLNWLETIQATTNARGTSLVKYNVASQQLVEDKANQHQAQGLKVYRSGMTIDMKMLHEGDLFAMLNVLEEKAQGLFTVEKCNIESTFNPLNNGGENMHANCELGWYTFKSTNNIGAM